MKKKIHHSLPVLLAALAILLQACSAKKNTAGSRFWQAMNTRYNVYYHGKTNYDEQIKVMENEYEDDYSQRMFAHPAEARSNPKAPQPGGSFDRTIEKMQKAISLHSIKKKPKKKSGKGNDPKYKEWMKREEYNPFMHNCWYLLAKSQYMKGDFLNAAATFRYISRHFGWKPELVQEAQVWEALSYCAMGWTTEADNVLAHVHIDQIESKRVRALANLAMADYHLKDKRLNQAAPYLAEAVKGAKGAQKVRQNFLLGQVYQDLGEKDLAYQAYKKAGSSNSSSYRTKFNARIKQSAVFQGSNIESEVKSLRAMTRYDRNKEYLDQIYYAIGNLYLSRQDTTHAVENYIKAAEKSTRNGIDKAISQLTLGGIYFAQHKYDLAQPCYSEAIPQLNEDYPDYKALKQRSDVLDELAVYSQNVTLQDSLLRLSKMSEAEVKAVIKKIIDELKKKEKEEKEAADREEYLANENAKGNAAGTNKNAPQQFQINNDKSWYFYNTATKNAGKTAFQQQWGNRKLEDNWRRRNKNTFSFDSDNDQYSDTTRFASNDSVGNDTTVVDREALRRAEDPHYEEYYLKQIPKTEEQIQAAHDVIQEGLYNMGVILKDKLEDYDAAAEEFNELLRRYPDNTYRLDTYYNMYLMYMRQNRRSEAEPYRNLILSDFAESKYGMALQDPNYIDNLKNMLNDQEQMYEVAYANYLANNNEAVHEAYEEMMRKYPLSKIMPKFMFIDALSYVTQRNYDKFKETLKDMLQRYPDTDITPTASGIVKQLNAGRKLEGGGSNARGMLWSTRLSNDTTPADLERKFTPFQEDNDKPQVFILLYPTDSVSSNMLLYEVARHNFNSFVVKDYDLEQMTFGRLGLLVVKGFENFAEVSHYRTIFEEDKTLNLPPQVHPVLISESNFQLLLNEGRSFEDYFNYLEEKNEEKVEAQISDDNTPDDDATPPTDKKKTVKPRKAAKESQPKAQKDAVAKDEKAREKAEKEAAQQAEKAERERQKQLEKAQKTREDSIAQIRRQEKAAQEQQRPDTTAQQAVAPAATSPIVTTDSVKTTPASPQTEVNAPAPTTSQQSDNSGTRRLRQQKGKAQQGQQADKNAAKQAKSDEKAREKAEKEAAKQAEKAERERQKQLEKAQKAREDSIARAEKAHEEALNAMRQAKEDSVKNAKKARVESVKQAEKDRAEAKKAKEKERKQKIKEREQLRKQKAKERKELEKKRDAERKANAKKKKEEAKQRQQEAKQRKKEREEAAKERKREREAAAKAKKK